MDAVTCNFIQQEIYAYLDGELEGAQREKIDDHLSTCSKCSEFYAESLEFEKDLKLFAALPDQEPPSNGWLKLKDRLADQAELEIELPEYTIFDQIQLALKRNIGYVGVVAAACLLVVWLEQPKAELRTQHERKVQPSEVALKLPEGPPEAKPIAVESLPDSANDRPVLVANTHASILNPVSASFKPAAVFQNEPSVSDMDSQKVLDFPIPLVLEEKDLDALVSISSGKWVSLRGQSVELKPFMMDRFPVTNREYINFVKETGQRSPFNWNGLSYEDIDETGFKPVTYVSWEDADSYCKWKGMSLPSNAQWEWAAAGSESKRFPWGNEFTTRLANTKESSKGIVAVGSYPENISAFGVYDMVGNVREWVTDTPKETKGAIPGIVKNLRLMKGGSYLDPAQKSTIRESFEGLKDEIYGNAGIRCVALAD